MIKRNSKGQFIKGKQIFKDCLICKKRFKVYPSQLKKEEVKFCSRKCYAISMTGQPPRLNFKGKKHTEGTIQKMKIAQLGSKHWNWKGGYKNCRTCGKKLTTHKGKTGLCVNCMKGENNPNWKGGISETLENYWGRRRLRVKNAEGSHTLKEWEDLKKKYNYTCLSCEKKEPEIKLTKDHIIPLLEEGSNYIENIQPLCKSCNSIKSTKIINFINLWLKPKIETF